MPGKVGNPAWQIPGKASEDGKIANKRSQEVRKTRREIKEMLKDMDSVRTDA